MNTTITNDLGLNLNLHIDGVPDNKHIHVLTTKENVKEVLDGNLPFDDDSKVLYAFSEGAFDLDKTINFVKSLHPAVFQ